jgi:hypothetical protein
MIDINKIMQFPTVHNNTHESAFRSYQILEYVKWMLEQNTPAPVILSIIKALQVAGKDKENGDADGLFT